VLSPAFGVDFGSDNSGTRATIDMRIGVCESSALVRKLFSRDVTHIIPLSSVTTLVRVAELFPEYLTPRALDLKRLFFVPVSLGRQAESSGLSRERPWTLEGVT